MKNEKFRAAWDKLTPDSNAKQRMLASVMDGYDSVSRERTGTGTAKVYSRFSPRITAAAACMAVIIGVGGIAYTANLERGSFSQTVASSVENVKNSFVITANAQEMEYGAEVVFGEFPAYGRGCDALGEVAIEMTSFTGLPIRCEGENIDTVTYTLSNSSNGYAEAFLILNRDYLNATENDSENYGDMPCCGPYTHAVGTFTAAYDDQPIYGEDGRSIDERYNVTIDTEPVILQMYYRARPEELGYEDTRDFREYKFAHLNDLEPEYTKWYGMMADFYEAENNNVQVEVTVTYKDGTTETKTIDLLCKPAVYEYPDGVQFSYMDIYGVLNAE